MYFGVHSQPQASVSCRAIHSALGFAVTPSHKIWRRPCRRISSRKAVETRVSERRRDPSRRSHRHDCKGTSSNPEIGACHILGDRGLTNVDAELEKLSMDAGSTPQRIGQAHGADQLANFERHLRSAAATSRLPSPERAKPRAMPTDNRLRLYDHQGINNARRNPVEAGKNLRSKLLKASRFGDFLRSTLTWWRSVKISASRSV
jgi:hypothetical protein